MNNRIIYHKMIGVTMDLINSKIKDYETSQKPI